MRLRRLDLSRYGKFTGHSIDFGERIDGKPDLHIIYGPNEAGKSTALAGFLDLLFGIEMQSRYGFLHPYSTMRVGGCLELSVGALDLVRIKRPQPTLRDAANEPVSESLILGDLGGIDRNTYRTMFSLDDDTLEAGGKSILASNGELGQLLFSASAGLSELSKTLIKLRLGADEFAKQNTRGSELQKLKLALSDLKKERDDVDTVASEYNRLTTARDDANSKYQEALVDQRSLQDKLFTNQRLITALPHMSALRFLRERLEPLADFPDAPPGWLAEIPQLQLGENNHRSAVQIAGAEVKRLTEELASLVVDNRAVQLIGRLDRFTELRARTIAAELDLPRVRSECARAAAAVGSILNHLGRENEAEPAQLLLNAAQTATLNSLVVSHSGIAAKVAAASEELSNAILGLNDAQRAIGEPSASEHAPVLASLRAALTAVRMSDHTHRLRTAHGNRHQLADALSIQLAALAPWTGSVELLAQLTVPDPASVQTWSSKTQRSEALVTQRRDEAERHAAELARRAAELEAIGKAAGLVSDQEAADIRQAREAAWAEHRRRLDSDSAAEFEAVMRRDDIISAARLGHERDLAELREKAKNLSLQQSDEEQVRNLLDKAEARHATQIAEFARVTAMIGPEMSAISTPAWLQNWLGHRGKALETWELLKRAERDIQIGEADAANLLSGLMAGLTQAGLPFNRNASLEALSADAEMFIERDTHLQALRHTVEECRRDVERRELAVERASLADKTWATAWRQACSDCWFGVDAEPLPSETVRGILEAVAKLEPALNTMGDLDKRVRGMEEDQASFGLEVERLSLELGIESHQPEILDRAQAVLDRVQEAQRAGEARQTLQAAHADVEKTLHRVESESMAHTRLVGGIMDQMQAGSLIELASKLKDAELKVDLKRQIAETERDILTALQVETLTAAQALLGAHSAAELELERATLTSSLGHLEIRIRELYAASVQASDRLAAVGGDDAVAKIEERRRTTLLVIEEGGRTHLRLRIGIAAAERALRAYRDQHRSSMMQNASKAFSTISRGAYRGLTTQPDKETDVLVAIGADGSSKLAADLSKGARFQLYLALRAAGYHEFASVRQPVPFIADDIMETFDDLRSAETFRVFEGMAKHGQVIYLTHHNHLRVMAEQTVPDVRVHDLSA